MSNIAIVWFRNDLRLHDNEALTDAFATHDIVIPVYVIDPRKFRGQTSYGFDKVGPYRCQFILESLTDLRQNLQALGSQLYVREGHPEDVLFELAKEYKARSIYCNRERTSEEVYVQDELEKRCWSMGQELNFSRGKMLYYTSDLPFPIAQTPDVFTSFRKEVERIVSVRNPLPVPQEIGSKGVDDLDMGAIPSPSDYGHGSVDQISKFVGGESAALKQLQYYLWDSDLITTYKETRNGMLGWDFSSKLSPWLSQGCLSPKRVFQELLKYEQEKTKNKSTYWLFFELMWRDFFRLMGKKHGNDIFKVHGTKQEDVSSYDWSEDMSLFRIWSEGRTGVPIIDANMREINATGWMSNRGRQIVASFLVNDMNVNWLMGAEYFESLLIDYDPCSNYGNWNYIAGVGSDPREDRYFNPLSQSRKYDSSGDYVRHWIPEIKDLPDARVHKPWEVSSEDLSSYQITLGKEYPKPVVDTSNW